MAETGEPASRPATASPLAREAPKVVIQVACGGRRSGSAGQPMSTTTASGRAATRAARVAAWAGRRWASRTTTTSGRPAAASRAEAVARSSPSAIVVAVVAGSRTPQRCGDAPRHRAGRDVGGSVQLDHVGARERARLVAVHAQGPACRLGSDDREGGEGGLEGEGRRGPNVRRTCDRSAAPARADVARSVKGAGWRPGTRRPPRGPRPALPTRRPPRPPPRTPRPAPRRCRARGSTGRRPRRVRPPRSPGWRRDRRRRPCRARR